MYPDFSKEKLEKLEKEDALARQILDYARNTLFMNLRFMKNALGRCSLVPYTGTISANASHFFYNPEYILKEFKKNQNRIVRTYLHMVLHCIFQHQFVSPYIQRDTWNLACDIAVEKMIQELHFDSLDTSMEVRQNYILERLEENVKYMTAEKIYEYLMKQKLTPVQLVELQELFEEDNHKTWYSPVGVDYGHSLLPNKQSDDSASQGKKENPQSKNQNPAQKNDQVMTWLKSSQNYKDEIRKAAANPQASEEIKEMWQKLSQQLQLDLETFSKGIGDHAGNFMQNLQAINRERCNYESFLKKFAVSGEVMKIDTDSFDYNFYCYGRSIYQEAVLIEPLEYKDEKRIQEFVIAIDTSGSVAGETVQRFMQKTYNILKSQDSFFSKVNIHIIQCDAEIQEDVKITNQEDFDNYLKHMTLKGFGGTDFRPVFTYIDKLIHDKEFTNLKGMIYFTDGYGVFPERQPDYKTAFVFLDDEYNNYEVPVWAIRVILSTDDIMED